MADKEEIQNTETPAEPASESTVEETTAAVAAASEEPTPEATTEGEAEPAEPAEGEPETQASTDEAAAAEVSSEAEPDAKPEAAKPEAPAAKEPIKAKLKELKSRRDAALESGDGAALKRVRAQIRRQKRKLRKAG